MGLTAQELITIVNAVNIFHLLDKQTPDYAGTTMDILLAINQIINRCGFEAIITINNTINIIMMD